MAVQQLRAILNRSDVEAVLRAATGGASPVVGDVLLFTENGWSFRPRSGAEPLDTTFTAATVNDFVIGEGVELLSITENAGGTTLTGIAGGFEGRRLLLFKKQTGAGGLVLAHNNAGSALENRFDIAGVANVTMNDREVVFLMYLDSRWRVMSSLTV